VSVQDELSRVPGQVASHRVDTPDRVGRGPVERVPELDALRGLAALAVVVFHSKSSWLPWGWASVDLFFVLSGYLITAIVLKHGGSRGFLRNFYVRRGLRVWPLYFLVVGLLMAASPVLRHPFNWSQLPYTLTFTQNVPLYWNGSAPEFCIYLLHTWTLALEEQFYLLWPALLLLVGPRRVIPVALVCAAGSFAARSAGLSYILLGARCEGLAFGGLLAALLAPGLPTSPALRRFRLGLAGALAGGAVTLLAVGGFSGLAPGTFVLPRPGVTILAFNLLWLGVVGLTVLGAGCPALAGLRRRELCWLGQVSYGLYLIHHVLLSIVREVCVSFGYWKTSRWLLLATIAASLVAAGVSHAFFEAPILSLKRHFRYGDVTNFPRDRRRSRTGPGSVPAPH
jgi:peptidoglycan/LPS O-acetylase OafA/YrhL